MPPSKKSQPPIVVIHGDEEHAKLQHQRQILDELLPQRVDRGLALTEYDGSKTEEHGGPAFAAVMDDLMTLPFLSDRRVVLIRDADKFITAYREKLENYLARPAQTATLVMICRSMPSNTRLYKAAAAAGGRLLACKKPTTAEAVSLVVQLARERGKRLDDGVANRLVDLVGLDQGMLCNEIEKLCLYAGDGNIITNSAIDDLVCFSREEKVFAAMDAAALGQLPKALLLWHQVTAVDKEAVYKAVGGIAYKLRSWLAAHDLVAQGVPPSAVAPKVGMWRQQQDLLVLLRRQPPGRVKRLLAGLARLDTQAKLGFRSIECGVERLLTELATTSA